MSEHAYVENEFFFFCVRISGVNDESLLHRQPIFSFTPHGLVPSDFGKSSIVNFALGVVLASVFYIPSMSGDGTAILRDRASHGGCTVHNVESQVCTLCNRAFHTWV